MASVKLSMVSISEAPCNYKGEVLYMFSKYVQVRDSNKAEELVILEHFASTMVINKKC